MYRLCCLLLLLLSWPLHAAWAQSLTVRVTENGQEEKGLPGALVRVKGGLVTYTDSAGVASLPETAFPATLEVAAEGYNPAAQRLTAPTNTILQIRLDRRINALQETVITGLPTPMRLQNALSQYRVVNRAALDAMGAQTLAEALPAQLNINVGNDAVLGSKIQMQGLGGDKVKILIDGMPVNGRESGNIDMGQISLNNIERVEIVQGPMSVVYGSDAIGGVINLITKKNTRPWEAGGLFNYESAGRYNVALNASFRWDKRHGLEAGGGRNFFNGWGDMDTVNPQRRLLFKPKEQYVANGAYTYTAPSGFRLQLATDYLREKVTNKGSAVITPWFAYAMDDYYHTARSNNRLVLEGRLGTGRWKLQNSFSYYNRVRKTVLKDLVTLEETPSLVPGEQDTSRFNDFNFRSNYSNRFGRLQLDGGYDVLLQQARSGKFPAGQAESVNDYALYANAAAKWFKERLTAQLGLRGAYNDHFTVPLTASVHLLYSPGERLQLRGSYGRGFRAPSLKEMYLEFIDQNHHIIGNPDLAPERGDHVQVSLSRQYKTAAGATGQVVLTGYYNEVYNQIVLANPDTDVYSANRIYANIAHLRNTVCNLQADVEWKSLYLAGGVGLTHFFEEAGGFTAFDAVEVTANARYFIRSARVSASVFYKYTGTARQLSQMPDGKVLFTGETPAFHMLNASLERRLFGGRVTVIAGVNNILDVRNLVASGNTGQVVTVHAESGSVSFLPRRVFTTVRLRLN